MASPQLATLSERIKDNGRNARRATLHYRYADRFVINPDLTRALVSFQANKGASVYRWFKYREAFSVELVKYILERFRPEGRVDYRVLDPFAGAGTTLTVATKLGCHGAGIELLPVGTAAIKARLVADKIKISSFERWLSRLEDCASSLKSTGYKFPHIRITQHAFPRETEKAISAYHGFLEKIRDADVRHLFQFALLSILEEISYTRKDGQYLRWDARSGKALSSRFDKGTIHKFEPAITNKLRAMLEDLKNRNGGTFSAKVKIIEGSSLECLPNLANNSFDLVITSPPYCNRYDYTRTYALELAYLGHGEEDVKTLRQKLLSATVENRSKRDLLFDFYKRRAAEKSFKLMCEAFDRQAALQEVLELLCHAKESGLLNNNNIPSMVGNYFFEMNLIVHELARVLRPGGKVVMVNDNVQYFGEEVPVDLILSDFASQAGLSVDAIWVLPRGKGNSSQQMEAHGRNEIRKCVYVWSKEAGPKNG